MKILLRMLALTAVVLPILQGCALSREPLSVMVYSVADEDIHNTIVRSLDTSPPSALAGGNRLPPRIRSTSTLYGMDTPSLLRVNWTYKGLPERVEILDLANNPPPEGISNRFIVVLIEGEHARLGWLGCDRSNPQGYSKCKQGGVLAEPRYLGKDIFDNSNRPPAQEQ